MTDIALTEGQDGQIIAHRADCPQVRTMAAIGWLVMTMYGCQNPLPPDVERHTCLTTTEARS